MGAMLQNRDCLCCAFEDGCLSGLTSDIAVDCPFDHSSPTLRRAWLDGFSMGRIEARLFPTPLHWWIGRY